MIVLDTNVLSELMRPQPDASPGGRSKRPPPDRHSRPKPQFP
ncbi:hypothetical protein SAMN03159453_05741 [Pseudomonas sp. NFIX28]|nr:hypothetical protein SAMN03159453_05741 [Pseudomonas sp. NFIX28]